MMIEFTHMLLTWLELVSLAFSIGVFVFRLPGFLPSTAGGLDRYEIFTPNIWPLLRFVLGLIIAASIGDLVFRAAEMSGRPVHDVFPALSPVISRTHYGTIWLIRVTSLALLSITLLVGRQFRNFAGVRYLMLGLGIVIAWTESASGHPSDQGDFTIQEMMDLLHLLAGAVWGGGVFVLSLLVLPSLIRRADLVSAADISSKFSKVAGFAVAAVIGTALYHVRTYVGSFGGLWKTGYGLTVVVKMVLLYFLVLLGGFNRYVSVPLMQHLAGGRIEGPGMLGHIVQAFLSHFRYYLTGRISSLFIKTLLIEAMLIAGLFLCAALLKHETPSVHLKHMQQEHMKHVLGMPPHDG